MRLNRMFLLTMILLSSGTVFAGFIPFAPGAASTQPMDLTIQQSDSQIEIKLVSHGLQTKTVETQDGPFTQLSMVDAGRTGNAGHPGLPFKGVYLEVPPGVAVEISSSGSSETLPGTYTVMPVQPPELDCSDRGSSSVFRFDSAVYMSEKSMPGSMARITSDGYIRNRRVLFLEICPVQYTPATGEISATPEITVTVSWTGTPDPTLLETYSRLASPLFDSFASRIIANELTLQKPEKSAAQNSRNGAEYLIITADQFADELLPLVEWKTLKGFKTRLVTLSEIGGTTSAAIQSYLQNAFDTWSPAPVYVLLVGDVGQMPSTTVSPDAYGTSFPSDLPYSKLAGSDYYPDIFLGRFSVGTDAECATVVNKVVGYDRNPEVDPWYENALVAAYFQDEDAPWCTADRWFMETAMHVYEYLETDLGMNTTTALCTSASNCDTLHYQAAGYPHRPAGPSQVPQEYVDMITPPYQARNDITAAVNAGVSIVQHRDHGSESGWADPPFSVNNVNNLANGSRLPVVFSLNCLTGAIDYGSDCFAEAFQKHPNGGAVGLVAATRVSYSGYNDLLCHGIYTGMFPDYDTSHAGNIYANSIRPCEAMNFGKYYMSVYEGTGSSTKYSFRLFHWFGDPEMMIRTQQPAPPTVTLPAAIPAGSTEVSIPVAEDYAMVAISQEGNLLGRGVAMGGMAEFVLDSPVQAGIDVTVVVTGFNLLPLETSVLSTAPDCGLAAFDNTVVSCNGSMGVEIMDFDLNLNPTALDTVSVNVFSSSDPTGINVSCTEISPDLGIFTGTLTTGSGGLMVVHGDIVTLVYEDADCNGSPETVVAETPVDCIGPVMSDLVITPGAETITASWTTHENALPRVYYGTTYPPTEILAGTGYETSHNLTLPGLDQCADYVLMISTEDQAGNELVYDNSGAGYLVTTHQEVAVINEPLDINPQWVAQGQWAWGQPTGQGGEHGQPDPTTGYTGDNVYGFNLNGDYPNNMSATEYLVSPSFNCSGADTILLTFWGWVGVEKSEFDHVFIDVSADGGATWQLLYENPEATSFDGGAWTNWEFDITSLAIGSSDVKVRWGMGPTDAGWQYCGWNIDDIQIVLAGACGTIPTPEPTPTVYPTNTPVATYTPTPTPPTTPTPTPTQSTESTGVTLLMPATMFETGDTFYLYAEVMNAEGQPIDNCPLFVLMDVYGQIFFAPSFNDTFDNYLNQYPSFAPGVTTVTVLPEFAWPAGTGSADGIIVYGALTDPGMSQLMGEFDMKTFGWR